MILNQNSCVNVSIEIKKKTKETHQRNKINEQTNMQN